MIRELSLHQVMHVTEQTVVVTTLTGDESACTESKSVPAVRLSGWTQTRHRHD